MTGRLTLADRSKLDLDNTASFALTVQATDNGSPAKSDVQWARNSAVFDRLTEMRRELRALQKQVAALQEEQKP